jgi:O-antigen ligase
MNASFLESLVTNRPIEGAVIVMFVGGLILEWLRRSAMSASRRRDAGTADASPPLARRAPHPGVVFLPLLILVNALDVKGYFLTGNDQKRYAIGVLFLIVCVMGARRGTALTSGQGLAVVGFVGYVAAGAVAARFYTTPESSSLPIAAGAVFLLVPLFSGRLTEPELRWLIRTVTAAAVLELFVHFLAACEFIDTGINRDVGSVTEYSNGTFTHEKAAIAFMAFHLLRRRSNRLLQLSAALMMLVIFANYPAGTYLYAFAAYLALLLLIKVKEKPAKLLVASIAALGVVMAVFVLGGGGSVEQHYYEAVGKTDNTSTREVLWQAAMHDISQHPWFGSYFSGEASVRVSVGNLSPMVPPHNDYLNIALLGGWVGLALFVLVVYFLASRLCEYLSPRGDASDERRLIGETALVGLVVFMMSIMFNPSLLKVSLSALFFCLLGVGACIGTNRERPVPAPGPAQFHTIPPTRP